MNARYGKQGRGHGKLLRSDDGLKQKIRNWGLSAENTEEFCHGYVEAAAQCIEHEHLVEIGILRHDGVVDGLSALAHVCIGLRCALNC